MICSASISFCASPGEQCRRENIFAIKDFMKSQFLNHTWETECFLWFMGMMALANMLEHPEIRPETMSILIAGRENKRSNKDLGRVLAIAHLASIRNEDALLKWLEKWLVD